MTLYRTCNSTCSISYIIYFDLTRWHTWSWIYGSDNTIVQFFWRVEIMYISCILIQCMILYRHRGCISFEFENEIIRRQYLDFSSFMEGLLLKIGDRFIMLYWILVFWGNKKCCESSIFFALIDNYSKDKGSKTMWWRKSIYRVIV